MRNAGLEETQAGIKIAGRIINNLRYADATTLMAESEEELKSLLMKVKEEGTKMRSVWELKPKALINEREQSHDEDYLSMYSQGDMRMYR